MTKLFSNGCSFLTSRPKNHVDTFVTEILSKEYQLPLENYAKGGRGNDRVSFTTKVWLEQNKSKDYFVVIGWSSAFRMDYIASTDPKPIRHPGTELLWQGWKMIETAGINFINSFRNWHIEDTACYRYLDNIIDLQNYFKLKKIPYVMYNALPPIFNLDKVDFKIMHSLIDMKRFFRFESSHYNFIIDNNLIVDKKDPHPSTKGHQEWAKLLKEFIDANNLRTI
jgi:hypothetical protein